MCEEFYSTGSDIATPKMLQFGLPMYEGACSSVWSVRQATVYKNGGVYNLYIQPTPNWSAPIATPVAKTITPAVPVGTIPAGAQLFSQVN